MPSVFRCSEGGRYFFFSFLHYCKNIHILVQCTIIGELEYICINSIKEHFKIHPLPSLHELSLLRSDLQFD